ncbi:cytochrome P450 [Lenzites betulinus]|nr:cytochrome P450 [Lenzites betulinus]
MELNIHFPAVLLSFLVFTAILLWRRTSRSRRLPLPPGPNPMPIIGNVLDIPTKRMAPSLRDMSAKYGDIVYLNALGQPMVVLNSYEAAIAVLEGHSATTSSRPQSIMADLCGFSWQFGLHGYNQSWRERRKDFHSAFQAHMMEQYQPVHLRECRKFLQRLLKTPEDFMSLTRTVFAATIMDAVYAIKVAERDDPYITLTERLASIFNDLAVPGRYLVEVFPFLRFLPSWFPGAAFKKTARTWRPHVTAAIDVPYAAALENMANGRESIVSGLIERKLQKDESVSQEDHLRFRDVAGIAHLAGGDTTMYSMQVFFLAMVRFPEVQRKAQQELDAIIGPDRLPEFADKEALPYINAVMKEVIRWHSVVPLGVSHYTTEEDEYNGYRIPAGTIIMPNAWAMSRDPVVYPDPERFMPERFLEDGGKYYEEARDPEKFQICPGRHFALEGLFIVIASVLHVFDIGAPLDEEGKPVEVKPEMVLDYFLS